MRYLAEVQRQSKGFMGGVETKLKLLAGQRNDRSWSTISGNEFIEIEDVSNLGDGALVIADIVNRQVQGKLESASKEILGVLQIFSRLLEKTQSQEEEIEVWKESLTIQSEELSKREIEMETRLEQLEKMEEELDKAQKEKEEAEKIRLEFQAKSQELEKAWEQLKGEQNSLEQQIRDNRILNESQINQLQTLLNSLSLETNSSDFIPEKLCLVFNAINNQQEYLDRHWQKLEQYKKDIQQEKNNATQYETELANLKRELDSAIQSLEETQNKQLIAQESLSNQLQFLDFFSAQQQFYNETQESFSRLGIESSDVNLSQKINLDDLENMPLPELEAIVNALQKDLEKVARFVNEQEEELSWQCQAVKELETKIQEANEFDRLALEQELSEEKEAQKMLHETLVGQRRSLKERHEILLQHSRILKRRQGKVDLEAELQSINLEPIKANLWRQQEALQEQEKQTKEEIEHLKQVLQTLEQDVQQQTLEYDKINQKFNEKQQDCQRIKILIDNLQAQILFYEENLQPLQDSLNIIRQNSEEIESLIAANSGIGQNQILSDIDEIIKELVGTPEMVGR
ncbi:MAG: pilus motility taxis protein HmpF [Xenococcaceae cyanobacterium MO_234.B1]|nr:pilus motility taxis protein HmpF [Xenococcaceae cyanobacterium MO_234.B1]